MILFSNWHPCLWLSPPAPCWWYEPSQWFWLPPRDVWTWYMAHQSLEMDLEEVQWPPESSDIESWLTFKALPTCWVRKMQKKDDLTHHLSSRSREHNKKLTKSPSHLPVVPSQFQPTKRIGMLLFQPLRRSSVTRKSLGPQMITKRVGLTIKRCNHRTFLIVVWRSGWLICFYLPLKKWLKFGTYISIGFSLEQRLQ